MLRSSLNMPSERRLSRITEAAQHARNIAQWRLLPPALFKRPGRLPLKIYEEKIGTCPEKLPQMQIAVDANALPKLRRVAAEFGELFLHPSAPPQHFLRMLHDLWRQVLF